MNQREIKQAEKLLRSMTDRTEVMGWDRGNGRRLSSCLTAHWLTGGQKLFYTLNQVRDYVADRQQVEA